VDNCRFEEAIRPTSVAHPTKSPIVELDGKPVSAAENDRQKTTDSPPKGQKYMYGCPRSRKMFSSSLIV
jgi:hypothetical protein